MFSLRYSREIALKEISTEGYEKIRHSHVAIVGIGATGSPCADLFVRAGLASIILIDGDTVDISNLHRQVLFAEGDIGKLKVEAAYGRLHDVNRSCEIERRAEYLTEENVDRLIGDSDLVIDGTDNMETRRIINRYCVQTRKPWIFISSLGTVSQVKAIIPGKTSCLDCFTDPESEVPMSCEETGVLSSAPLMASSMAWTIAIRIFLGHGDNGDMHYMDPWHFSSERIKIGRNPGCKVCSSV